MKDKITKVLCESAAIKKALADNSEEIQKIIAVVRLIVKALRKGKKVVLFGNGGSAADAQHIACELSGKFKKERKALPAISLTTNTSSLTAIGNDYSFEEIFARQVKGIVNEGDVVIGISTSGRSPNIIKGIKAAKKLGAHTVGLTGAKGHALKNVTDICIMVPSSDTPRIQESHITIGHIICELVEEEL